MPEDEDDEIEQRPYLWVNPEAIWGCRINPGQIRLYVNENETLTISNEAAVALRDAITAALEDEMEGNGEEDDHDDE